MPDAPIGSLAVTTFSPQIGVFSPDTGATIGVSVLSGPEGTVEPDVLDDGTFAQVDLGMDIYQPDKTLVDSPALVNTVGPGCVRVAGGNFYAIRVEVADGVSTSTLVKILPDGTIDATWPLPAPMGNTAGLGVQAFAVSDDESTVYYSGTTNFDEHDNFGARTVFSFDLNSSTANADIDTRPDLGDIVTGISSYLVVPGTGDILACWSYQDSANPPASFRSQAVVRQYQPDNTLVREFTVSQSLSSWVARLARSMTPNTSFWISWGDNNNGAPINFNCTEFVIADGTIARSVSIPRGGTYTPFFVTRAILPLDTVPVVTDLNIVCGSDPTTFLITGDGFSEGNTVEIQDPTGLSLDVTIVDLTSTLITVTVPTEFIPGLYCVSVNEPEDV